jgi:hypothetical protein
MTQNARDKHEKPSETQALLQILAIGEAQVLAGQVHFLADVFKIIRARRSKPEVAAAANRSKLKKARALN